MARSKKVSKEALKSIIADGLRTSAGYYGGELQRRREKALEYYLGYKMGTEVEGRSQVISTDLMDTIESMLPSLLKPFTSSTEVVEFDPVGEEDEAAADQVTQYCNHIFLKDNDGIKLMHEAFKDALLSGFGCFKVFWEEKTDVTTETYEGLTDDEMVLLLADPEVEAVEHSTDASDGSGLAIAAEFAPASTHSLKIRRTKNEGRVKVETVAPEDFYIERRARTLEEANFVAHRSRYTASDLIAMGYSKRQVDEIPSLDEEDLTTEKLLREQLDDSDFGSSHHGEDAFDPTRRELWLYDCYIKCDRNGDGIAEWVRVLAGGTGAHTILDEEEVDGPPFATLIPIPMPHRFFGMSLADQLFEIQEIKTSLWRNYLDNVYVQSNHRVEVVEGMVNLEDALNSRPGGVVRVKQPGMIREMTTQPIGGQILEGLKYADEVKEVRTGVTKHSQGLAEDQLNPNQTATGAKLMLSMAQQRIEMIGRLFADGGVKTLFKLILKQVLQHQSKERIIRIKGQWVPMDPRNWSHQYDVTVKVGLGHGNDEKRIAALSSILAAQEKIASNMGFGPGSIVSRENVFNSLADLAKEGGVDPNKYFTMPAPDGSDIPPPKPDANETFMQGQIMIENGKLEAAREKLTLEHQQKMREFELKIAEMDQKLAIEREKIAAQMETVAAKIAAETESGAAKLEVDAAMARERLEHAAIESDKNRGNGEDYGPT